MKKSVFAIIVAVVLVFGLVNTPAFAEDFDEFDELCVVDSDEIIQDSIESVEIIQPDFEVESFEEIDALGGSSFKYYNQPEWYTASGYDAICAYITDEDGKYVQRCFFISDGAEWLMYDYGETASFEFFSKTEYKNELYIPIQKSSSRKDNTKTTGIDESKIPTMTKQAWDEMLYDWRTLSQVPFTRDSAGRIIYAGEGTQGGTEGGGSAEEEITPTPVPTPSEEAAVNTVTINNNVYTVFNTSSVVYNGKKHVISTASSNKSQTADIKISVYCNGTELLASDYSVKFFNNVNVNGYGGKTPYFTITLKNGKLKADKALLQSNKFRLTILPADINSIGLTVKGVKYNNGTLTLTSPVGKINDVSVKLVPRGAKNRLTGSYVAGYKDGNVIVYGVNNYAGTTTISLSSAKTINWTF